MDEASYQFQHEMYLCQNNTQKTLSGRRDSRFIVTGGAKLGKDENVQLLYISHL